MCKYLLQRPDPVPANNSARVVCSSPTAALSLNSPSAPCVSKQIAPSRWGPPRGSSPGQGQDDLMQQLRDCEAKLQSATDELQSLRTQQASEMEEVESYVAHIRGLLEERENLTADYERDNEQLRLELHHIRQQQEVESKELAEMLAQKDLREIELSTPSELVAYLLVERPHCWKSWRRQKGSWRDRAWAMTSGKCIYSTSRVSD
ncbi:hypothetical protein WMY93_022001 [Mugilogobius chulae]|uniref:Uncharacterized protein n=1 Tax=Mugilogobius chulae TaxID=88201 RepID=A0AAW0NGL2_9GOBI